MNGQASVQPADLGIAGRLAARFQNNPLTPLLAILAALLGLFAVLVTPREEEPQIDVTMANVMVAFPGASARDVELLVAVPAEQVLGQMVGLDHIYSVSKPGLAVITVQFKVGVKRELALTRLYDVVHANSQWLPANLGALPPLVRAKGIDDVPILALTLWSPRPDSSAYDLERVAHLLENELKRVPGTRELRTLGGPGRVLSVEFDAGKLAAAGLSIADLRYRLQAAQRQVQAGALVQSNQSIEIETGPMLDSADAVAELVVGRHNGLPVYLHQVATVSDGPATPRHYVWHWQRAPVAGADAEHPAVTLQITKQAGANAVEVSAAVLNQIETLRGVLIPDDVQVTISRDYGATADAKASKLIQKLLFATLSVVALVFIALGKREAAIVGVAVLLTLTTTLFASWAWGFTLNRVSLFALIFSIGILVDDAIVVVENIHRQRRLQPDKDLLALIPLAVGEVGGPTILATFTVIAALLPMAFVSGLMGPYMAPIPINAALGMLLSLAIAFVLTPWLAARWLQHDHAQNSAHGNSQTGRMQAAIDKTTTRLFATLLDPQHGAKKRRQLTALVAFLIALALALPVLGAVVLKMLPLDNKSEFQVLLDMPSATALEQTSAVLHELGEYLSRQPEVENYQAYAGTSAPITFNGLVRQYDARSGSEQGDLQVNLLAKELRAEQSHAIAQRLRPHLETIARKYGADLNVVEVPPGPPVPAPIVAEIYGPDDAARAHLSKQVRTAFAATKNVTAIDSSLDENAPRWTLHIDRSKATLMGVAPADISMALQAALSGEDVSYVFDGSAKYATPIRLIFPLAERSQLESLLQLRVNSDQGALVPIGELVQLTQGSREQYRYHKDGLPVSYVYGDYYAAQAEGLLARGVNDSPLYGMFAIRAQLAKLELPYQSVLDEYFIRQPAQAWDKYAVKWDGEWTITYETFRDMGAAYAVGLLLIYLLVVAQFKSYVTPLIIMAPIPLTIIGVMPGHALLNAPFTATSMIGMIALAGIIVRNSILLVDFIEQQLAAGVGLRAAVMQSVQTRTQPIVLTALAAMTGALFILDDPIFNGLAISLIFGILISTLLTLVLIPLLYFVVYQKRLAPQEAHHD